jgi:hypothetical protein
VHVLPRSPIYECPAPLRDATNNGPAVAKRHSGALMAVDSPVRCGPLGAADR